AVFPSRSKGTAHPLLGIDGLRAMVSATPAPVLAIGGITLERLEDVAAAGAAGVAAIGLFIRPRGAADRGCGAVGLRAAGSDARRRVDRGNTAPLHTPGLRRSSMSDRTTGGFGARLRDARERRGVSLRQIANATKISIAALEALERDEISKLPGGIFSRAFVRSYAIEVGLDPEATIQE